MKIEMWWMYLGTILIMMSTPGPSHILMLSNSIGSGFKKSLYTAFGDLTANFFQMIVASVGLVGILHQSQQLFLVIKWIGVLYLLFLGLKLIATKGGLLELKNQKKLSNKSLYFQGFIVSTR